MSELRVDLTLNKILADFKLLRSEISESRQLQAGFRKDIEASINTNGLKKACDVVDDINECYKTTSERLGNVEKSTASFEVKQKSLNKILAEAEDKLQSYVENGRDIGDIEKEITAVRKSLVTLSKEQERANKQPTVVDRLRDGLTSVKNFKFSDIQDKLGGIFESVRNTTPSSLFSSITSGFKAVGVAGVGAFRAIGAALISTGIGAIVAGVGAAVAFVTTELFNLGQASQEINRLAQQFVQLTDLTEDQARRLAGRVTAIQREFNVSAEGVFNSAISASKQFGIDLDEALDTIELGFIAGADASGELLANIREYAPQAKAAGLELDQFIAVLVQSERQGVFSDKGIDTVKEFGLRIREQTAGTKEALEDAFGKQFTESLFKNINDGSITTVDALQQVAGELNNTELSAQEVQTVLADVFGGAGEDAGIDFIRSLGDINLSLEDLIDTTDEYTANQIESLALEKQIAAQQAITAATYQSTGSRLSVLFKQVRLAFTETINEVLVIANNFPEIMNFVGTLFLEVINDYILAPINSASEGIVTFINSIADAATAVAQFSGINVTFPKIENAPILKPIRIDVSTDQQQINLNQKILEDNARALGEIERNRQNDLDKEANREKKRNAEKLTREQKRELEKVQEERAKEQARIAEEKAKALTQQEEKLNQQLEKLFAERDLIEAQSEEDASKRAQAIAALKISEIKATRDAAIALKAELEAGGKVIESTNKDITAAFQARIDAIEAGLKGELEVIEKAETAESFKELLDGIEFQGGRREQAIQLDTTLSPTEVDSAIIESQIKTAKDLVTAYQTLKEDQLKALELSPDEVQAIINGYKIGIQSLQEELSGTSFFNDENDPIGIKRGLADAFKVPEGDREAFNESIQYFQDQLTGLATSLLDAQIATADARIQLADDNISQLEKDLAIEQELAEDGKNNNVEAIEEQIALEKEAREKALADKKRAAKQQLAIDTAIQASALITAAANALSAESSKGLLGLITGAAAIAGFIALFLSAKSRLSAINSEGGLYEGGYTGDGNPRQRSGHFTHRGEVVVSHKPTKVYRSVLETMNTGSQADVAREIASVPGMAGLIAKHSPPVVGDAVVEEFAQGARVIRSRQLLADRQAIASDPAMMSVLKDIAESNRATAENTEEKIIPTKDGYILKKRKHGQESDSKLKPLLQLIL